MTTSKIRILESLCRTCMRRYTPEISTSTMGQNAIHLISIYQEYKKKDSAIIKIMDLLQEACPQLSIGIDDELPKKICKSCLDILVKIHIFQQKSLNIEQQFREMIGEYCDPLQEIDEVDPLNNGSIQVDEGSDVSMEPIINANNPDRGFFTLIERNGQIIEAFNAVEKCDQTAIGNNGSFNKNEDHINTATCDNDKQSDVSFWKFFKDDCDNTNLAHTAQTRKEREQESEEFENNLTEQKATRKCLIKGTSNDVVKLFEPASKESGVPGCNESNSDTENEFGLTSHLSEGIKCDSLGQDCAVEENHKVSKKDNVVTSKIQGFTCDKCGKVIKTRRGLKIHFQKHLNRRKRKTSTENGYICTVCGARLKTRVTFRRHLKVHEEDETKGKYKCQICNKVFSQAEGLLHHTRTHTRERPFLCSICGKSFAESSGLKDHYLRHGTEFNYQCSLCPKKFRSSSGVSTHKAIVHTTVRPHVCDVCGASFKKPYSLKKHKINHGEKKHKCDYCEMKFSQVDQCRRHMRTHTGEKPYKCKYCERAFAQSNDMIKHLRFHVGENVYRCDLCPRAFRLLCELRPHFASHKDDDEQTKLKNMEALKEEEERLQTKIESEKANVKPSTCMGEEETVYCMTGKMEADQTMFSIFNTPPETLACGKITIKELLNQATPQLSLDINDFLPKSVCKNCLDILIKIHNFQQKCLIVEQRLSDLAKECNFNMRAVANEDDDPLINSKITDFTGLQTIVKIEMGEVFSKENNYFNNSNLKNSQWVNDDGQSNHGKNLSTEKVEHINSDSKGYKKYRGHDLGLDTEASSSYGTTQFVCMECGTSWKTPKSLQRHEQLHLSLRQINLTKQVYEHETKECLKIKQSSQPILKTYDLVDGDQPKRQDRTRETSFACKQCSTHFKSQKILFKHQKIHHRSQTKKKKAKKLECSRQCSSEEGNNNKTDNGKSISKSFKNEAAPNKVDQSTAMEVEEERKQYILTTDEAFECDECGSRVKTRKSLIRHKRIHLRLPGEKPQRPKTKYECKYCPKVFCQSSSLKDHMRIHTGETPFLCSECGKAFKILSNMKQHLLRHGTDRPYECPNCPKRFPCLTDLASHAAVHNKAKTHVCDICGSAFVKPYLLKKHKMYHTGEKNHKCDFCDMRFVLAEQCRRHMRTHTGEKPYKCKYCTRAFAQSNDLTKHLRIHLGDSVYKCDLCPQGFRLLGDLRSHFNTHKKDDDETRQRNLQALKEEELRLQMRFGVVQTNEQIS